MKKQITLFAVAAVLLFSCKGPELETVLPTCSGETVELQIRLDGVQADSRSFYDEVDKYNSTEKAFNSVKLYLYGADGNHIQTYTVDPPTKIAPYLTLQVPREACGQQCTLFAIANHINAQTAQPTVEAMYKYDNSYYGWGNFNVSVESYLLGHYYHSFMMSGVTEFYMQPYGLKTITGIELIRLLSKVVFRYRIDENFQADHNGALIRIDRSYITNVPTNCYVFHRPAVYHPSPSMTSAYAQTPVSMDGYFNHVFYTYELGATRDGTRRTCITIYGIYDYDGDFSTLPDQTEFMLDIPINPDETGIVERNTYYRIEGVIKGVGVQNLDLTFTVKDWKVVENSIII